MTRLEAMRRRAADVQFANYDFGATVVEDYGLWKIGGPEEWWRPIVIQPARSSEGSRIGRFVVRFRPGTAIVLESAAYDPD